MRALGLCAKAGRLICGTEMVCEALKSRGKKVFLVIGASDNSENTAKRLRDRCAYYGVSLALPQVSGDELADAVGKRGRVAAAAITDEQLCRLVSGTLKELSETM